MQCYSNIYGDFLTVLNRESSEPLGESQCNQGEGQRGLGTSQSVLRGFGGCHSYCIHTLPSLYLLLSEK